MHVQSKVSRVGQLVTEIEAARSSTPRTLMLVGEDKSASWQWRVDWPCRALSNRGFVADWCTASNIPGIMPLIEGGRYNVVLTSRAHWNTPEYGDQFIASIHGAGLAWVYELDDDGWSPETVQRQARLFEREWNKGEQRLEEERRERIRLITLADGVIVSSEYLATIARRFTDKPVFCVPNLIMHEWFAERQRDAKRVLAPLTIGWSGGLRDGVDLENVASAWTVIAARYPDVKFVVHGTSPTVLTESIPPDRGIILPWSSLPDYPRALMNIDIACCAVAPSIEFNYAKTAIKWYETTLSGAACVVSKTLYGPEVRDGYDGLVAESTDEWTAALSKLIEDASLRRKIQRNARRSVLLNHALSTGWPLWIDALNGALEYSRKVSLRAA